MSKLTESARGQPCQIRWKPVVGFETTYEVSEDGRVRSISRTVAARLGFREIAGRELKQKTTEAGYKSVSLHDRSNVKTIHVHRVVAEAFLPKTGFLVRHLNGDRACNSLSNLAWGSHVDNEADKRLHGRIMQGKTHHASKLNDQLVREIRSSSKTDLQWSKELSVARYAVYSARNGLTWRHVL